MTTRWDSKKNSNLLELWRINDQKKRVLDALAMTRRDIRQLEQVIKTRDDLFSQGRDLGITTPALAEAAGVSASRVRQIVPAPEPEPWPADEPVPYALVPAGPLFPAGAPLLSQYSSTPTHQPHTKRMGAWVDLEDLRGVTDDGRRFRLAGDTANDVLTAIPPDVLRVFLCGPPPQGPGANNAERVRSWGLQPQYLDAWKISHKGHYVKDVDSPCFRFSQELKLPVMAMGETTTREVEILFGSSWFGDVDALTGHAAWTVLGRQVAAKFPGATLLSTPATTGRDLWRRTIPAGKSWPVMSDQLRELIASTSGQGRMELLAPPGGVDSVDAFTYLDARFAYAALTWGMPVGEPQHWIAPHADSVVWNDGKDDLLKRRGRWLVRATVPPTWDHVGILPDKNPRGGWSYPSEPGTQITTWADACEVSLAGEQGWEIQLLEGFTWAEGKPLDTWTKKLREIHATLNDGPPAVTYVSRIAAKGARAMLLHAVGAFAARAHMISRSVTLDQEEQVPDNARVTIVGDRLVWEEPAEQSAWTLNQAHPEWSAAIWARARVRLLDAPGPNGTRTGALHVPRDQVIAFRTDAIFLNADPGWEDDGKIGRFRVKGHTDTIRPWPTTNAELFRLRDESEKSL
jgi:hypothetical protein